MATKTDVGGGDESKTFSVGRWARQKGRNVCSTRFLKRRLPIIGFLQSYDGPTLLSDFIAGITVGLTFIPGSMASAVLAGLPSQYGLYSSFMCYFVYAVLGSSNFVIIGPSVITAMLCKPFVDKFGPEIAITLCFYSGCLVSLLGVLNLGFLVEFISAPVLDGFLSAAAISAISSQVAPLIGIKGGGATFVEYWVSVVRNIQGGIGVWDTVLGFSCIAALVLLQYIKKFEEPPPGRTEVSLLERVLRTVVKYLCLGRTALVVLVTTGLVAALSADGTPPVQIADEIEGGFPEFSLPQLEIIYKNETLSFGEAAAELSTAITIPLIIVMETTAAAKAFAGGRTIDATQEMIAAGFSNVLGSFVQSFPVSASVTRTTINHNAGAKTPVGQIFAGGLVLMALGLFTDSLKFIPDATLAAVIICAVPFLIQVHNDTIKLWRANKSDLIPLHATFIGCLLTGLDYGMIIGILVNLLLILYQAARPKLSFHELEVGGRSVLLVTPDRSVTYPAAEHVKRAISKRSLLAGPDLHVVLDGNHVQHIDSTAVKVFKSLIKEAALRDQQVVLWNWRECLVRTFIDYDKVDPGCFHREDTLEMLVFRIKVSGAEVAPLKEKRQDSDTSVLSNGSLTLQTLP